MLQLGWLRGVELLQPSRVRAVRGTDARPRNDEGQNGRTSVGHAYTVNNKQYIRPWVYMSVLRSRQAALVLQNDTLS